MAKTKQKSPASTSGSTRARQLRARQLRAAVLIAEMRSYEEAADIVSEEFGIKETRQNTYRFAKTPRGRKLITYLRKRFLDKILAIPIANKAVRLNRLEAVYRESMTESLKSVNAYGRVYEVRVGAATEALRAAREEIEGGNKTVVDNSKHTHYHLGERLEEARKRANAGRIPTASL